MSVFIREKAVGKGDHPSAGWVSVRAQPEKRSLLVSANRSYMCWGGVISPSRLYLPAYSWTVRHFKEARSNRTSCSAHSFHERTKRIGHRECVTFLLLTFLCSEKLHMAPALDSSYFRVHWSRTAYADRGASLSPDLCLLEGLKVPQCISDCRLDRGKDHRGGGCCRDAAALCRKPHMDFGWSSASPLWIMRQHRPAELA
jgi:hypothetical protein